MARPALVRSATLDDVPGIQAIHANCEDPWADAAECAAWVGHRVLRGFLVDVALLDGVVAGHAEWIVSPEPPPYGRHLYLGMLQVHADHQRRGVGRAMIEARLQTAKDRNCAALRTDPDEEAKAFYRSCGFVPWRKTETFTAKVHSQQWPDGWRAIDAVPEKVVETLPMRWGWVQGASAHMWEVCNRPVRAIGDEVYCPCACRTDGRAYVQLECWAPGPIAMALAWAEPTHEVGDLVSAAMALTRSLPIEIVEFATIEGASPPLAEYCDASLVAESEIWARPIR